MDGRDQQLVRHVCETNLAEEGSVRRSGAITVGLKLAVAGRAVVQVFWKLIRASSPSVRAPSSIAMIPDGHREKSTRQPVLSACMMMSVASIRTRTGGVKVPGLQSIAR